MQALAQAQPDDARTWQVLGQLHALQGNNADAADAFAHAFSLTSHQVRTLGRRIANEILLQHDVLGRQFTWPRQLRMCKG